MSVDLLCGGGHDAVVVDLATSRLPAFDNDRVFEHPVFAELHELIASADGVVLAMPIYNWSPPATVKSLVEATGATGQQGREAAWFDKLVTFVCSAGLPHSAMATGSLAQSLMLDFKCVINPHSAYVTERDWTSPGELVPDRAERLARSMSVHAELAGLLAGRIYRSGWEV